MKIRCTPWIYLSKAVPVYRDVKQGCILALLLFNLYLNPIIQVLAVSNHHPPILANHAIPELLYADDEVIIIIIIHRWE